MRQRHFIDSHKGATALFVVYLIWHFEKFESNTLWLYFGLHGCYGLLWMLKSRYFGDAQWDVPCSIWRGLYIWAGLSLYWISPWLIATERGLYSNSSELPGWWLGCAAFGFGLGVFYHFAADMQKHTTLKLQKGLFEDGLWANSRNPNYLGELLIYASFSSLAQHWIPYAVMALFIVVVWVPNMRKKDASLSRYEAFGEYKRRSGLIFPRWF